jgi:hypothetical protein
MSAPYRVLRFTLGFGGIVSASQRKSVIAEAEIGLNGRSYTAYVGDMGEVRMSSGIQPVAVRDAVRTELLRRTLTDLERERWRGDWAEDAVARIRATSNQEKATTP